MVIDAAKGVEAQTRKLFEVCRRRGIPIFTFINKFDRPTRDPIELVDELEHTLGLDRRAGQLDHRPRPLACRRVLHPLEALDRAWPGRRGDRSRWPRRPARRRASARARTHPGARRAQSRHRGPEALRRDGLSRGPSDADPLRQRAQGLRRKRAHRRAGGIRAEPARAGRREPHRERGRRQDDRLRVQDPGEHGPKSSRPHRLHARLLRPA